MNHDTSIFSAGAFFGMGLMFVQMAVWVVTGQWRKLKRGVRWQK